MHEFLPIRVDSAMNLAYPLGSKYKIAHGLSNAVMLPYVLEYNLPAAVDRFAEIAHAIGINGYAYKEDSAKAAIWAIKEWIVSLNIPLKLSALEIPEAALEEIAVSALKVQRLLKNNVREISYDDALAIYRKAY